MPNPPANGNGLPEAEEEENARREEVRQEEERLRQLQQDEAALAQREQDERQRQEADRQRLEAERLRQEAELARQNAAVRRGEEEDWRRLAAQEHPAVNFRRRRGASLSDDIGLPAGRSNTDAALVNDLRAALALSREHITLQNQMREMESRLNRAENGEVESVAQTSVQVPRSEAAPPDRPLHGTPTTPFVVEDVDNPEEIAERATRRLMVPPLKPFTGVRDLREGANEQPFSSWIKSFEQEMALAMINRTAWLKTLRYFLQDAAATVYDARINSLPHDRRTYQGMVEVLRHTYDRCVKEREAQRALCNLHWDPKSCTIDEFYARVEKIAASAYPQFDEGSRQRLVTRQFIEAMPPTTQRQIDTRIDLSPVPLAIQSFQVLDWAREITRQEEKYTEAARAYRSAGGGGKGSPGADQQARGDVSNQQQQSSPRPFFGDRGRGWRGNRGTWRGVPRGGGRGRFDFRPNNGFYGRNSAFQTGSGTFRSFAPSTGPGWQQNNGRWSPPMRGSQLPMRGGPQQHQRGGSPQQPRGGAAGRTVRDVSEISCFNCNQKGHYASACTRTPAISMRLIQGERIGMISAADGAGRRQPPQNDGRMVAESAKKTRPTSTHGEKTVLRNGKNGKKKKNGKKRPSPPQLHMPPAPTEHEPTAGMQEESSEPTEHEPTRKVPTPTELHSATKEKDEPTPSELHSATKEKDEPTPSELHSATKEKEEPSPTEQKAAKIKKETPTPTERRPAEKKENGPLPTEQQAAEQKDESSAPREQKPTQKKKNRMKISPKKIISGESSQESAMVDGQPAKQHQTDRWRLKERLREAIMEKRSGFRMEMFLLKRSRYGTKSGKQEKMMIPLKKPIYGGNWDFTETKEESEAPSPIEQETAVKDDEKPLPTEQKAAEIGENTPMSTNLHSAEPTPTERQSAERKAEVSTPMERQCSTEEEKTETGATEQQFWHGATEQQLWLWFGAIEREFWLGATEQESTEDEPTPTEHKSASTERKEKEKWEKEETPPTEQQASAEMNGKKKEKSEKEAAPPIEHQASAEKTENKEEKWEEEATPPTEQQASAKMIKEAKEKWEKDVKTPTKRQSSLKKTEKIKQKWEKDVTPPTTIEQTAAESTSAPTEHQPTTTGDDGEQRLPLGLRHAVYPPVVLPQLMAEGTTLFTANQLQQQRLPLGLRHAVYPPVVLSQHRAVETQLAADGWELKPGVETIMQRVTEEPAVIERRPAETVHTDATNNDGDSSWKFEGKIVKQVGYRRKRVRRGKRKGGVYRKPMDDESKERLQRAVSAQMGKPYTETRLMTIPVSLNGWKSSAQIDTGSPITLVGRRPILCLMARHGRDAVRAMIKPLPKPYYDYSGNEIGLKGTIAVDLQVMKTRLKIDAFIDATAHRDVMLGMDVLAKIGCALRLYSDGGLTDLVVSKPQKDGKSIVTLTGGDRDITHSMVLAEQRYLERRQETLDNYRKRRMEEKPSTYQANEVKMITLEPRSREFVRLRVEEGPTTAREPAVVLVEETSDSSNGIGVRIAPQLVEWKDGHIWLEVRNEEDAPRALHLQQLQVNMDTDFTMQPPWIEEDGLAEWVMHVPESGLDDLSDVWQPRMSQLQSYDEPMYLDGLQYTSIDERRTDLLAALDVGDAEGVVTEKNRQDLIDMLLRNHDVLALTDDELGCCTLPEHAHAIDTGDTPPIALPLRRLAMTKQIAVRKTLNTMKRTGVIQASCSPWSSPIVPVWKRDGSMRVTVDYRRLNEVTKKDRYPLSRCDELIDSMGLERPRFFTTLDLVQGFHQMRIADDAVEKTAFSCQEGHFEYLRMPMGLTNSPASFQRLQNEILKGTDPNKVKVYLDDVAIATNTFDDHLLQLGIVFARFRKAGLRVKVSKCKFLKEKLVYLGFEISKDGVRPNEARIFDVQDFKPPTTVKMVRQFVGLCSFYRRFVPNFSKIARPLTNLTRKEQGFQWGEAEAKAFQQLKDLLTSKDVLAYPQWGKPYYILCDASSQGLGAILHQKDELGRYRPIAYASRATDKYEQKYGASELECLCLVWALQHFHYYIWGQEIYVESDHQPLTCLNSKQTLPPRLERWNSIIIPYAPKIVYRRGRENEPADALSRYQKLAGTAEESALDAVVRAIKNYPDPDVDLEQVDRNVKERQRQLQLNDPFWRRIIDAKEQQKDGRPVTRMIGKMAEKYRLLDGVLYFMGNDTEASPRLCVPQVERRVMIERYHEQRGVGGHLGAEKVLMAIAAGHYWPQMKTHVEQYCRECRVCLEQRGGAPRHKPPLAPIPAEAQPFVQVQIDVMNLPKTKKGNKKVLGIVDSFTGYLIYVPMKNEEATTVARKLHKHLFTRFSAPKRLISDNGTNFHSNVISELNKRYGVQHYFTTTFTPHSNGKTEKANSTMRQMLAKMTQDHPEDWDELVADVMWAYNTTPIPTTGFSPHFLVFGSNPAVVSDSVFDWPTLGESLEYDDYISQLERRRAQALKIADVNRSATQERQKVRYDKKATMTAIVLGEKVMVYRPNLKTDKLKPKFDGPYEVVWLSDTVAKVRRLVDGVIETHNLDKLSRCLPTAQVTNKHQPYKPRKYQKGKKIPQRTAKGQKVKKLDWIGEESMPTNGEWDEFSEETPETSLRPPKSWTTQVPAYINDRKSRMETAMEPKWNGYGQKIMMMQDESDLHRSLRCLFCNEFVCVCEDDVRQELKFESSGQSSRSATSERRMAEDDRRRKKERTVLDPETEEAYERIVFERGAEWEELMQQENLPSDERHAVNPPVAASGSTAGAAAASTSQDVTMVDPNRQREGDFGDSSSEDSGEQERRRIIGEQFATLKRTAAERGERVVTIDSDMEYEEEQEDIAEEREVDDQYLLNDEELEQWAEAEATWYQDPFEREELKRIWGKGRGTKSKEARREGNRRARQKWTIRRKQAIAAGLEDPELAKVKRKLGVIYPRAIEEKLQLAQRSTRRDYIKSMPPKPQVEAIASFEPEEDVGDIEMAVEEEQETTRLVTKRKKDVLHKIRHGGIESALRTQMSMAPSAHHVVNPPGVFEEHGLLEVKQSKKQKKLTASHYPTRPQKDEMKNRLLAEVAGIGTTTVDYDEVGRTVLGFRDQPLVVATFPAILEAREDVLQQEYDQLFNTGLMPDDPTLIRPAVRNVENAVLFYNGDLATLDVDQALELKTRDRPVENLLPADATVIQELPTAGPLSGASTLSEALARKSQEYAARVAAPLEHEPTLLELASTLEGKAFIEEEEYDALIKKQIELRYRQKKQVVQRGRSKDLPIDTALHTDHPVKQARGASAAAFAAKEAEQTVIKWTDNDSEDLKKKRAAEEENRRQVQESYDRLNRIAQDRREVIRSDGDEWDMEITGVPSGAMLPEQLIRAQDEGRAEARVEETRNRESEVDERADADAQRHEAMRQLAKPRYAMTCRAGGLLYKIRQLSAPGQDPTTAPLYQEAMRRLHRYDEGVDRDGQPMDAGEMYLQRLRQQRRDQLCGYKIYEYKHPLTGEPVWMEEVAKGVLEDVYSDFPDTTEERRQLMREYVLTDMAMVQFNRDTQLYNNEEYRNEFFKWVSPRDFASPLTKRVFNGNLLMPKHVLTEDPPVIANRAWQMMSERADTRCTQFPTKKTAIGSGSVEDERESRQCAYSYDQAGTIIRSHFLLDYRIEPVMRYVDQSYELQEAIEWLLQQPDLEGVIDDKEVRFLGWDLENCAASVEWRHWRPLLKRIYNVTPAVKGLCGPYAVLLTLSNCWGYTAVVDLRYARGSRREENEDSPPPAPIIKLLSEEYEHVKFVCFDFGAEQIAWNNSWGQQLPKERFIDLQVVGDQQLRKCANDVMYTVNEQGQICRSELGLGKGIYAFTGDFNTALEKAGFLKQYNPWNRDTPANKYLKMPEAIVGNICDLRYAAKDSIFTLFLTMRVCLVDFYTQRQYRMKQRKLAVLPGRLEARPPPKSAYLQMVEWTKQIGSVEPELIHNRLMERAYTKDKELPKSIKQVMEEIGRRLAYDLVVIERRRDATDSSMKIQLPYLTEITTRPLVEGQFKLPRTARDIRTATIKEKNALTPREWLTEHGMIPVPSVHEWAQLAISNGLQVAIRYVDEWMHLNDDYNKTAMMQGAVVMWREFQFRWKNRYVEASSEPSLRKQLEFEHTAAALRLHTSDEVQTMTMNMTVSAARLLMTIPEAQQTNPRLIYQMMKLVKENKKRFERERIARLVRTTQDAEIAQVARESEWDVHSKRIFSSEGARKLQEIRSGDVKGVRDTGEEQSSRHLKLVPKLQSSDPRHLIKERHLRPQPIPLRDDSPIGQAAASGVRSRSSSIGSRGGRRQPPQVTFKPRRGSTQVRTNPHQPRRQERGSSSELEDMDGTYRQSDKKGKVYPVTPYAPSGAMPMDTPEATPMRKLAPVSTSQEQMWSSTQAVAGASSRYEETTTDADSPLKVDPSQQAGTKKTATEADSPSKIDPLYPAEMKKTPAMREDTHLYHLLVTGEKGWYMIRQGMGEYWPNYQQHIKTALAIMRAAGKTQLTTEEAKKAIYDLNKSRQQARESTEEKREKMPPPKPSVSSTVTRGRADRGQAQQGRDDQQQGTRRRAGSIGIQHRVVYAPHPMVRVVMEPHLDGNLIRRVVTTSPLEENVDRKQRYGMESDYLTHPLTAIFELATRRETELENLKEDVKSKLVLLKRHPTQFNRMDRYLEHVRKRIQLAKAAVNDWRQTSEPKSDEDRLMAERGFYAVIYNQVGPKLQHELVPRMYGWEYDGGWEKLAIGGNIEDLDYLLPKSKPKEATTQESDSDPNNPWKSSK